ncbi:MAG: hypothetical protein CVU06_12345 [Bacteroidetes bacterium HGW-Bacteroidetes-22]|nr:MAG: hypothetical protein CVU06_12345 [Bacteroidetes bacterium HGW-Bacteroidetes-22]
MLYFLFPVGEKKVPKKVPSLLRYSLRLLRIDVALVVVLIHIAFGRLRLSAFTFPEGKALRNTFLFFP